MGAGARADWLGPGEIDHPPKDSWCTLESLESGGSEAFARTNQSDELRRMSSPPVGLLQISDHKVRYFVYKLFCFLVREDVRSVQDCCVCQRLHCCHADESGEIEIGDIDFIPMSVEIAANECMNIPVNRFDILQSPNSWDLFRKDAMKLGIDAVAFDCDRNELANRPFDRARSHLDQDVMHQLQHFLRMPFTDSSNQSLLAWKILVERADTDACRGSDPVGAGPVIAFFH